MFAAISKKYVAVRTLAAKMLNSQTFMKVTFNHLETRAPANPTGRPFFACLTGWLAPQKHPSGHRRTGRRYGGFTLAEVMMSVAISAITIGGVATGYVTTTQRAEWATYSAAAHSAALQHIERAISARWDPLALPATDELVSENFPAAMVQLDLPGASGTVAYVTNRTTITSLSVDPPLKMIQVDSTWSFMARGPFTNTVITYRSP